MVGRTAGLDPFDAGAVGACLSWMALGWNQRRRRRSLSQRAWLPARMTASPNEYAKHFERNGFELEIRPTAGSVENYELLLKEDSGVDVALVQGGTMPEGAEDRLQAVCSVYFEPLWVFYRGEEVMDTLAQLKGKRLAIGVPGSGVRALATRLLKDNGFPETGAYLDMDAEKGAAALTAGEVDALFMVIAPEAPAVQKLIRTPGVRLMSFAQADAYARRYRFLSRVTLYRGVFDLGGNVPAEDVQLIAPAASIVGRKSLHHGSMELLVRAAQVAHSDGTLISEPEQFPSARLTDLEVGSDAKYYLRQQPGRWMGTLPFWLKSLIDRLVFLVIPLLALLVPLLRFAPVIFRWGVRSRITRYYNRLQEVEEHLEAGAGEATIRNDVENLEKLEHKLAAMSIPAGFMPDLYDLKLHVERLHARARRKLDQNRETRGAPA